MLCDFFSHNLALRGLAEYKLVNIKFFQSAIIKSTRIMNILHGKDLFTRELKGERMKSDETSYHGGRCYPLRIRISFLQIKF